MLITDAILTNVVQLTRAFVAPLLSSRRGDHERTLKIDGGAFANIVALQVALPVLVSVTSAVISAKLLDTNRPLEELTKELRDLIDRRVLCIDVGKREELTGIVEQIIGKLGASHEQARELVDKIVDKLTDPGSSNSN